jgi:hypothetical protein
METLSENRNFIYLIFKQICVGTDFERPKKIKFMPLQSTTTFNLKSDSQKILGWQPTDFLDKKGITRIKG